MIEVTLGIDVNQTSASRAWRVIFVTTGIS